MKLFTTLFLVVASCYQVLGEDKILYNNFKVYRVTPKTNEAVAILQTLEEQDMVYDFWTSIRGVGHPVDIMVAPHLKFRFNDTVGNKNFQVEEFISDVQALIDNERLPRARPSALEWTDYHTLDEINQWITNLATQNPSTVKLVTAGRSYEGRDILGVKVSFKSGNENRTVFIESNIHAREWISSAVATWILNELLTSTDTKIRQLAESHDWYVVPVFNPDGFEYTRSNDRLWRKTRVPYGNCYGADPNRNWGYHFNEGGSSSSACSETYSGPSAFSEPSTKSLSEFITTIGPQLQAYISFHSYSQYLLLSYGYSNAHLDNYDDLLAVGKKAIASLAQRYNTQYEVGNIVDLLYVASGGSMDWVKGTFKTPITYTYELRDTGRYGFILPANQILPTAQEVLDSIITIFDEFGKL